MLRNVVIFLLLSVSLLPNRLAAQMSHIGLEMGYGDYSMHNLSSILDETMSSQQLRPVCVSNFPGYVNFGAYLGIERKYFDIGAHYTLMSTGSRYSLEDYSGSLTIDALIVGNAFGLYSEVPLYKSSFMRFFLCVEGGIVLNDLTIEESFRMDDAYGGGEMFERSGYESSDFYIKPYIKMEYTALKNLGVFLSVGEYIDLTSNNMHEKGSFFDKTTLVVDWLGIRASLGLTYRFQ